MLPKNTPQNAFGEDLRRSKSPPSANNNKEKTPREDNGIILEGPISIFLNKHRNVAKRYLVLNRHAFFVYSDEIAWKSTPDRPLVFVPLCEVANVDQREFAAHKMLHSGKMAHAMEIALK